MWKNGPLVELKIYFNEKKSITLDSNASLISRRINPKSIRDPDIQILNDSLAGISDYGNLFVINDKKVVLFDINAVNDSLFNHFYYKAIINYETPDLQFLKSGFRYDLKGKDLVVSIYYYDSLSIIPLQNSFRYSLIK